MGTKRITYKRGDFEAVKAKLSPGDARSAYVTMTFPDGARRPVASFWQWGEAVRYVNEKAKAKASDAFHAHLDACSRCEEQPFNLCPLGDKLLKATA